MKHENLKVEAVARSAIMPRVRWMRLTRRFCRADGGGGKRCGACQPKRSLARAFLRRGFNPAGEKTKTEKQTAPLRPTLTCTYSKPSNSSNRYVVAVAAV
jgi:hypothetical protein